MLFKLIKHNLKAIFKSIFPFIIALLASVIFFNVTDYTTELVFDENYHVIGEIVSSEVCQFLHGFAQFFLYISLILLAATTLRAIWRRFSTNFFSDEAYLTHTLPVSRTTLWNTQICSILITLVSVIAFIILNCFILLLTRDGQRTLDSFGLLGGCAHCVGDYYYIEPKSPSLYLILTFIIFAEFLFMTLCGITGIILKNRFGKNIATLSGVAIYLLGGAIVFWIAFIKLNMSSTDLNFGPSFGIYGIESNDNPGYNTILFIGSIYACYSVILYFVNQKLLKRGINLD